MAEDKSNDHEVVPTKETGQFHFRVWLSPAKVPFSWTTVASSSVAGCKCDAVFLRCDSAGEFRLTLIVRHASNPTMEGIKVIPNMVLIDKTGSPASTGTGTTSRFSEDAVVFYGTEAVVYNLSAVLEDVKANCVVDDYFEVMCSVEVIRDLTWASAPSKEEEELPDLGHDLAMMWGKQELTDVSFDVDGENIPLLGAGL